MNNTLVGIPARYANLETDILMLDDYLTNRENRKVAEMIDATEMMIEAGREDHQPVFYFLAGENLATTTANAPTPSRWPKPTAWSSPGPAASPISARCRFIPRTTGPAWMSTGSCWSWKR